MNLNDEKGTDPTVEAIVEMFPEDLFTIAETIYSLNAEAASTPTPTPKQPGFEAVFALAGLLAVAYLIRREKAK